MLGLTLEEAQKQLTQVNKALNDLIMGKRITFLKVGSASFAREYHFSEITFENLTLVKNELLTEIQRLSQETPVFNTNASFPLLYRKGGL